MNPIGSGLALAFVLAGTAAFLALMLPAGWRARLVGPLTGASGLGGAFAGGSAMSGADWQLALPQVLPLAGVELAADVLAGWFLLLIGVVTAVIGLYTIGYAGRDGGGPASRPAMSLLPVFCGSMLLVPIAASVSTFLLAWELMAVASLLLVLTRHRQHESVRTAGIWYAAMTQAGFVTVLIGLWWLAATVGTNSFDGLRSAEPAKHATGIFLLCLIGFASKAGAVPLHPWLPKAHAEAPSHVSALMSAAMVKLGIYGLLRVGFDLLGGGPRWWWLVVAGLGVLSALYGIVQAMVANDLKRLLAFSTCENVGLILLGIGFAGMLVQSGQPAAASVAVAAALLHTANHAGFKTLLFCGAGSVLHATGTRDLDRLGGLSRRMPATTALVTFGALAAAALPPGNGFLSEWVLVQALLHQAPGSGTVLTMAAPIGVAVIALTAGIGVATFVKAVGTGFLARPRSAAAAQAHESPPTMLAAMAVAAALCAALALMPAVLAPALGRLTEALGIGAAPINTSLTALRLSGVTGAIRPLWIALGLVAAIVVVGTAVRLAGARRRRAIAWGCGDGPLTARMEYTATSYAEPLQRVFDDVLAPERDVDVTHAEESAYHLEAVTYRQRIPDRLENRLYRPVIELAHRVGLRARDLASGSIHRYLGYMLAALVIVLVAGVAR